MPFRTGDFLLVDYTARVKETGEIIETTNEEEAKAYGIYSPERVYEPALVIIGEGRLIKGFEEVLAQMDVNEERVFEVPPEKAYGTRDPSKLRTVPLREFTRANIEPVPGKVVEINGAPAVVRGVTGGRVLVDFNHPLAGKVIEYRARIVRHVTDDNEKLKLLLKRRVRSKNVDAYEVSLSDEGSIVTVKVPESDMLSPEIQLAKRAFARDVFAYIPIVSKVIFVEELENPGKRREGTSASSQP